MPPITLENAHLRTTIDPDQGTSLHSLQVRREGAWLSLMPDVDDPACVSKMGASQGDAVPLAAASFLMIPYSNRIAAGAFTFAGQSYQLKNADQHAIHGDVRRRLALVNRAQEPMPAGCGWHPFFNRTLTRANVSKMGASHSDAAPPVHLNFQVENAYPDGYGNRIPSGPAQPPAKHQDFRTEKPLLPDNFLDTCFHGYDGQGHIT